MFRYSTIAAGLIVLGAGAAAHGATVTLQGTIRDFCAPDIANSCTRLTDFEGAIPGVVTGMVAPTLTGGLPIAGPEPRARERAVPRISPSGSSIRRASTCRPTTT